MLTPDNVSDYASAVDSSHGSEWTSFPHLLASTLIVAGSGFGFHFLLSALGMEHNASTVASLFVSIMMGVGYLVSIGANIRMGLLVMFVLGALFSVTMTIFDVIS